MRLLTPSLVKQYDVGLYAGADDSAVANVEDTQFIYILLENSTSVAALRLDEPANAPVVQIVDWSVPVKAKGHPVGTPSAFKLQQTCTNDARRPG